MRFGTALTLFMPPALVAGLDEKRVKALRRFQVETNKTFAGFGASALDSQTFRLTPSQLASYVLANQRETPDMPAQARFMRLFLMLCVGGDDIISNYLEHGRFKGADVQRKLNKAFGTMIAHNLATELEAHRLGARLL